MDLIKRYEAEQMEKGKETELRGIKEREEFLSRYPIENIPNLTVEQYALGDNSFSHRLLYGLRNIASPGNTYISDFGIYNKKGSLDILVSTTNGYKKQFGLDYNNAFIYLKNEIVNYLEDVSQKNYNDLKNYRINSKVKNRLMVVYFYDRFFPICTEPEMDKCLKSVNILKENKNKAMVYKNLALVKWKKTVPELADWSNQMVLDFCLWLNRENITTNREELCNNASQRIDEEISSLNIEGESKKAIINVRVNQGIFRNLLLERYNKCCLCGVENPKLLIASHIKPWAESEPNEK